MKKYLIIFLFSALMPTGFANLTLANLPVGFISSTWYTAFGFELSNFSITAEDSQTKVISSIPTTISQPQYSQYQLDPTEKSAPLIIVSKGNTVNGNIIVNYTVYMTISPVKWTGSVVSSTVSIRIENGKLKIPLNTATNGNTSCSINPPSYGEGNPSYQYIKLYCWLSSPP